MRIFIDPIAKSEMREAARTYETHRVGLGALFREELKELLMRIRETPLAFQVVRKPIRRANLTRFPYAIFFILRESRGVEVIAVTHQRRDPAISTGRFRG